MTAEVVTHHLNDLASYKPAKDIVAKYPNLFSKWGLTVEGMQRDHNGMTETGACVVFKHKMLFHEDRLLEWFEKRHVKRSA